MAARAQKPRLSILRRFPVLIGGVGVLIIQTLSSIAGTITWSGGGDGSGSLWNSTANWTGGVLPTTADAAMFGATGTAAQIGLTASQTIGKITLDSASTISRAIGSAGASAITLSLSGNGGVLLENLSSTQTLTLSPAISGGTQPMSVSLAAGTISATGGIIIGADMSGTAFTKTGTGTLTLTGTNSYTGTMTINAGTVQIGDGGSTGTPGNANIAINSGTSLVFNRGGTLSTGISLTGSGTLVQSGSGTTDLTSASIFSGPVSITAGTLKLSGSGAIGNGAVSIASGGTFEIARDSSTYTMNNVLSGAGSLVKSGTGSLLMANPSTLTGTTTVKGGTLIVGATGGSHSLIGGGPVVLENAGTVLAHWAIGGSYTFANAISGLGGVTMDSGSNTATLSGSNTYTGPTTIKTGTLAVSSLANGGSTSGIGAASNAATNLVINGGTLRYTGSATSTDRLFSIGTASGLIDASGTGAVQFTNSGSMGFNSQTGARTLVLTGANTGDNSLASAIGDSGGATSVSKRSTGTWVLTSASSTYTGASSVIEGGTLSVSKLANGGSPSSLGAASNAAGNLTIANNSTLRYTGSGDSTDRLFGIGATGGKLDASGSGEVLFTNSGAIANGGANVARTFTLQGTSTADNTLAASLADMGGASTLVKTGTGKWVLTGSHTHSGGTTISGGTLQIGAGGTAGSLGSSGITNNGSLVVNRSDAITFAQAITGTGSLTQAGAGTTTLTNANTFSGTTTISSGALQLGNGGSTGSIASASIIDNGTLILNRSDNLSWSTPVSGSGGFTKAGAGTTTLAISPTYTGPTLVSAGKLQSSVNLSMPSSDFTVASGATLATNGNASWSIGSLNGAGTFENGAASGATTVTINAAGSFSGLVRNGAAATLSITKTGTGTQALDNANTYTGVTTISGGVLSTSSLANGGSASGIGSSSSAAASLVLNGGTLRYTGAAVSTDRRFNLGLSGGGLDASGSGAVNFTATDNLSFNGQSGARALTLGGTSTAANTLAARILDSDAATSVVKTGPGTWQLTNINTYSGGTSLNQGVLRISSSNAIGSGILSFNGGVLETTQSMAIGNNFVVNDASNGVLVSGGVLTIHGDISGSFPLYKDGSGTLIIAGSSNTVPTVVQNGTMRGSAANAGTSIDLSTAAAVFEFNQATSGTYGGIISGSGGISVSGSGGLALAGANTYTGATTVSAGVLTILTNSALGAATGGVSVQTGATVELRNGVSIGSEPIQLNGSGASGQNGALVSTGGVNTYAGSITAVTNASIAALPGSTLNLSGGLVKNGTVATLTGGGAITISGAGISGSSPNSDLVVDGTGTTVTLNTSSSYNGPTFIQNSGTLVLGISNALPASPRTDLSLNTGGTFDLNGKNDSVASLAGDSTGVVKNASTGSTSTLEIATSGGSTTYSGVIAGSNGGAQGDIALTKSGSGTQVLDGANSYTGGTTISGGTLQIGSGGTSGQLGSGTITDNAELKINRSGTITLGQAITGSGTLTQSGSGTTVLTGNNTYSGGTTISAGTLRIGSGGLSGSAGNGAITNNAALEINRSNSVTLGQAITGSGSLAQTGSGSTTLSGNANTYSGGTTITAGTLVAANSGASSATGTGAVTVQTGARLAGNGRITGSVTFQAGSKLLIGNLLGDTSGSSFEFAGPLSSSSVFEARFDLFSNLGNGTLNSSLAADQLVISGSDRLIDLDLQLVLADPNSLLNWASGDSWQIWNWGGISAGNRSLAIASITAPSLPAGLGWNTSQLNTTGILSISYVPEPSRTLLFLAALLVIPLRRRR